MKYCHCEFHNVVKHRQEIYAQLQHWEVQKISVDDKKGKPETKLHQWQYRVKSPLELGA